MELGVSVPKPLIILSDNLGATFINKNPINHLKLKHVAIDLYSVCERKEDGTIQVLHIPGTKQWADILTKVLLEKNISRLQRNLMCVSTVPS